MTKTFTNLACTKKEQQHDLTIRNLECVMEEGQQHDKTFINMECTKEEQQHYLTTRNLECVTEEEQQYD